MGINKSKYCLNISCLLFFICFITLSSSPLTFAQVGLPSTTFSGSVSTLGTSGFGVPNFGAASFGMPSFGGGFGAPSYGGYGGYGAPSFGATSFGMPGGGFGATSFGATSFGMPGGGFGAPSFGATSFGMPSGGFGATPYGGYGGYGSPSFGATSFGMPSGGFGATSYGGPNLGTSSYGAPSFGATSFGMPSGGFSAPTFGGPNLGLTGYGTSSFGAAGFGTTAFGAPSFGGSFGMPGFGSPTGFAAPMGFGAPGFGAPTGGFGFGAPMGFGGFGAPVGGFGFPGGYGGYNPYGNQQTSGRSSSSSSSSNNDYESGFYTENDLPNIKGHWSGNWQAFKTDDKGVVTDPNGIIIIEEEGELAFYIKTQKSSGGKLTGTIEIMGWNIDEYPDWEGENEVIALTGWIDEYNGWFNVHYFYFTGSELKSDYSNLIGDFLWNFHNLEVNASESGIYGQFVVRGKIGDENYNLIGKFQVGKFTPEG